MKPQAECWEGGKSMVLGDVVVQGSFINGRKLGLQLESARGEVESVVDSRKLG